LVPLRTRLILAVILAACSNPSGYQPISAPGGRVEIADDSSVQAPQGSGWMMKRSKDETSEEVLFGRDLTASPTRAEDDHTLRVRFDVYRATGGALVLTLISDDNFSFIQRTLLLQFTLVE